MKRAPEGPTGPYRQVPATPAARPPYWLLALVVFGVLLLPGARSFWPLVILFAGVGVFIGRLPARWAIGLCLIALAAVVLRATNFEPWHGVPAGNWSSVVPFVEFDRGIQSSQVLNFSGVSSVRVRGLNGSVQVRVTDGEHVLQIFRRGSVKVSVATSGGTLAIEAQGQPFAFNTSAAFELTVPPDMTLDLGTSNGRIDLDGSGRVRGVTARSSNGRLTLVNLGNAPLDATTSNGSIDLSQVSGRVSASTSNGSIGVNGASNAELSLSTSNGSINLTGVALRPGSNSNATTSNARITVTKPE
ncbi:MAG TPA: hypothetical protein VHN99_02760, partial [Deinococcales bacterium]|nr:hypothetical protein [Deinococcales bacterium]